MAFKGNCPHCGTKYVALTVEHTIEYMEADQTFLDMLARCGYCGRGVLVMYRGSPDRFEFDRPDTILAPSFPDTGAPTYTPENVAQFFRQAMENMIRNYDAAGAMFRKTLDTALKTKFPDSMDNLNNRIETAAEKGMLTRDMADWSHRIRRLGNDAAHESEPFSKNDAEDLKQFTILLLYYLFTLPGMLEKAQKRSKKDEARRSISQILSRERNM